MTNTRILFSSVMLHQLIWFLNKKIPRPKQTPRREQRPAPGPAREDVWARLHKTLTPGSGLNNNEN